MLLINSEREIQDWIDSKDLFNPYKIKMQGEDYIALINQVAKYFINDPRKKDIVVHEKNAKFKVTYATDPEWILQMPDLEIENLSFDVEIKKVDQNSYFVEFTKLSGDKFEFFNAYDEFLNSSKAK